mgnify:CR=1 FL=1
MKKKIYFIMSIIVCTICILTFYKKNIYALDLNKEQNEEYNDNGIKPVLPKIIEDEDSFYDGDAYVISTYDMQYNSELEVYNELEKRIKNALLNGETYVNISDMNINMSVISLDYYYAYSPYFSDGIDVTAWRTSDGKYVRIHIDNKMTIDETQKYFEQVDKKIEYVKNIVNDSMSDEEKALLIHDYFVSNSEYDTTYAKYKACDILMDNIGVCQSYAFAYMYIMNSLGINTYFVPSSSMNHAWNIIQIGDKYYHVDCTFDDPLNEKIGAARHNYLLLSDNAITSLGHNDWNSNGRVCDSDKYSDEYWRVSESPIIIIDNNVYYIYGNAIYKHNKIDESTITLVEFGSWFYSGFFRYGDNLYYNSAKDIHIISLIDNKDSVYYSPDLNGGYLNGCKLSGNEIVYAVTQNINNTGDIYVVSFPDGWSYEGDNTYYYENGEKVRGWKEINSTWYYFETDGKLGKNHWVGSYYVKSDGTMAKSEWVDDNNFYVNKNGIKQKNCWMGDYYLKADGSKARNEWVDNNRYYVDENGKWVKGWKEINNTWYYFETDGKLGKNHWVGSYYVKSDGTMAKSEWVDDNNFYVNKNGIKQKNCWMGDYYLKADGSKARNEWVDNNRYYVDGDGKWVRNLDKSA